MFNHRNNSTTQPWRHKKRLVYHTKNWRDETRGGFELKKIFKHFNMKKLTSLIIGAIIILIILGTGTFAYLSKGLPDPNKLINREIAESTKIYDRTGTTILYEIHGEEKRTLVPLEEIPKYLQQATIAIEDKGFYKHGGFSFWAIIRTFFTNLTTGQKAGASTLTQQFVKSAVLSPEKTYTRKLKEIMLAYRIEKKFTKDQILQMYLNEIPYGSNSYGVESASLRYFGKHVKDINLAEAAVLAAIVQAPSRYSPYGDNKERLIARQQYVLDLMVDQDYITEAEVKTAKQYPLKFSEKSDNITAPHFVMYIKELLTNKYGEKLIEQGGLRIYTTLDLYKQKIAEEIVKDYGEKNEKKYNATNAALVSLDPKTGQVLAMVGSRDYFNKEIDGQVNVALRPRQPGSSFKPIVYTAAFIKGFTPNTILYDVNTNFSLIPGQPYEPHNYDGKEHGPVTIRQALAGSLNIPAVKAIYLTGIDNVLNLAKSLGYTTLNDKSRFGLSLVLGGGEVKLLEHTNAFSALAREGKIHQPQFILKIEDKNKQVLEEYKNEESRVLEPNIARLTNSILSDNSARAYIFGEKNYLTLGNRPVAAKTGTTNDYKDAWTIGYTPSLVTGVWVGNNNNKAMKKGSDGSQVAAPIWHDYMNKVLGNTPIESFKAPVIPKTGKPILDGVNFNETIIKVDKITGLLATNQTPPELIEEKVFKQPHCILYYLDKNNPLGPAPENPDQDPQFQLWESRVQEWAKKNNINTEVPPTDFDIVHKDENKPTFTLNNFSNNQEVIGSRINITLTASAPRGIASASYYIDNNLLTVNSNYPFNLDKDLSFLDNGFHELIIRVCDDVKNCSEQKFNFNFKNSNSRLDNKISVSWAEPADGLQLTKASSPLKLRVNIFNQLATTKVKFYFVDKANKSQLINTIEPIETSQVETAWPIETLLSGNYKLYAESYNWQGQMAKSETITLKIIEEKPTATSDNKKP